MLTLSLKATGATRTAILDWLDQVKHCLNDGLDADSGRGDGEFAYTLTDTPDDTQEEEKT